MILVTIGTQLPFPRLIGMMAALAPQLDEEIVAQIGLDTADYDGIETRATLSPAEFGRLFDRARVIVAHAGIGTILSAKTRRKPLIIVPRRHDMNEHRNDHQLATARQIEGLEGLYVAWEAADLTRLLTGPALAPAVPALGPRATQLVDRLRREF